MPEGLSNRNSSEGPKEQKPEDFVLENDLKAQIEHQNPRLPEGYRQEEILHKGVSIGLIERIRHSDYGIVGTKGVWLVIDFDDVVNLTTSSSNTLFDKLSVSTGIPKTELQKLYEQSKKETPAGKKLFRFDSFVDAVKTQSGESEKVEEIVKGFDFGAFVDQGVRRSILALRALHPQQLRVSILTYGDPEYQKMRLKQTDIEDMVDDVIYTEESKLHVVQVLTEKDYQSTIPSVEEAVVDGGLAVIDEREPIPTSRPLTIMVDDSPDNLRDYRQLLSYRGLVTIRWKNPQAKRVNAGDGEGTHPRIVFTDGPKNRAAVRLFKTVQLSIATRNELLAGGEDAVLNAFRNESKTDELFKSRVKNKNTTTSDNSVNFESFIQAA